MSIFTSLAHASVTVAIAWLEFIRRESPFISGNVGIHRLPICSAMRR